MTPPVVVITGCDSGIGRTVALEFKCRGYEVWATVLRPESVADLEEQGLKAAPLDVTDADNRASVIQHILQTSGHIDILVNNAGYGLMGPMIDLPIEALHHQFATNTFAPLALIQAVIPSMMEQGRGTIVNIGSISGIFVTPFAGAYCATKAALHAFSDALRVELAPFGIQVVTVQPGAIASELGRNASNMLDKTLKKDSRFYPLKDVIYERASLSQGNSTSREEFAKILINQLEKRQIPSTIRIGKKSFYLPFLKRWLPPRWLDRGITRRFQLKRLNSSGNLKIQ